MRDCRRSECIHTRIVGFGGVLLLSAHAPSFVLCCCGQSRQLELRHSQKTIADQKVLILKLEQELQVGSSHARAAASAPSTPSHHDAQLSHNMQLLAAVGKAFSPSHRARQVATSWRQLCRPLDGKESLCVYFGYSWRRQCRFHGPWPGRGSEW